MSLYCKHNTGRAFKLSFTQVMKVNSKIFRIAIYLRSSVYICGYNKFYQCYSL